MSDIFKKIKSIEPEDEAVISALGLKPLDVEEPMELETSQKIKEPVQNSTKNSVVKRPYDDDPVPDFIRHEAQPTYMDNADHEGAPWMAISLAVIGWLITAAVISFVFLGFQSLLASPTPWQATGMAMFFSLPALALILTIYAWRRLSRISSLAGQLEQTTRRLMTPDDSVIETSRKMTHAIRDNIKELDSKITQSQEKLSQLKTVLNEESEKIAETSYATENRTATIADRLLTEREALWSISKTFDERMESLAKILDQHSENLSTSTQEAEQKIQEARVSVEAAAKQIVSASDIVREKTVNASERLENNHKDLVSLAELLQQRSAELDAVFGTHADGLRTTIASLRSEQNSLGKSLEERLQKIRDMSLSAQVSAEKLNKASLAGTQTVEVLKSATELTDTVVKKQFSDLENMVTYSSSQAEDISERASRKVQESLEQTRMEIARIEDDMLALQKKLKAASYSDDASFNDQSSSGYSIPEADNIAVDEDMSLPVENAPRFEDQEKTASKPKTSLGLVPLDLENSVSPDISVENDDIPELRPAPMDEPVAEITREIEQPGAYTLEIMHPEQNDIQSPDPDEDITSFEPDILKRTVPDIPERKRNVENKPWWKSLLGGSDKDETYAIDRITAPPQKNSTAIVRDIVTYLTGLGLAPDAIIDNGCIVVATETRLSQGANAMSQTVAQRLGDPIAHLQQALSDNGQAKIDLSKFAAQYHLHLEKSDQSPENLRSLLDTEAGRAFLLCDAALNARAAA